MIPLNALVGVNCSVTVSWDLAGLVSGSRYIRGLHHIAGGQLYRCRSGLSLRGELAELAELTLLCCHGQGHDQMWEGVVDLRLNRRSNCGNVNAGRSEEAQRDLDKEPVKLRFVELKSS